MRIFKRRRSAVGAVLVSAAATAMFALPASPASAVTVSNGCTNNLTANATQLEIDLTGTSPATVAPDASFTLSELGLTTSLPSSVFIAGYNLGFLNSGDIVPGNVRTVIEGTNTVEGTQTTPAEDVAVGPIIISDPDGTRGTGDETADPQQITVSYPDQDWTAADAGVIQFREDTVPLSATEGGVIINAVVGGAISFRFRCSPGTVTDNVITTIDPAADLATTQIEGTQPPDNNFSFGKPKLNKNKGTAKLPVTVPGPGDVVLAETNKVKPDTEQPNEAETVKLDFVPKGKAKRRLNRTGSVKVTAEVTYTPTDGDPNTKEKQVRLVKR